MDLKNAIRDLVVLAIGLLIVDVVFETVGIALAALNTAVNNVSSYVSAATLATTVSTLLPIVNIIFVIGGIWILLEIFGADKYVSFG